MAFCRENLPQKLAVGIRRNLLWLFVARFYCRNLPQEFALASSRENFQGLFAVGFLYM